MSTRRADSSGAPRVEGAAADCGRLGLGAAEIADGIGWTRGELAAVEARWRRLAGASGQAHAASCGWWEARLRRWTSAAKPGAGLWGRVAAERLAGPARPEPARPRRETTAHDRAKAVRLLLAEADGQDAHIRSGT